jgi:4-hydroxybenzoate polyprenyltransferase
MIAVLRLIRAQNLLIMALTQYLFRYAILIPIMQLENVTPVFSNLSFALLVLSTVLIAAAGYAINDYFDLRVDRINRPKKIIVGKIISRRKVMMLHTVLSILACMIGVYVSYKAGSLKYTAINVLMVTLMWFYSLKFKSYFLVGNLLVSFATAMTIVLVWLFDMSALHASGQMIIVNRDLVILFLLIYSLFAFGISLIREIIKDIEDVEGDKKCGCSTIPVVIGTKRTKYILVGLLAISFAVLSYLTFKVYGIDNMRLLFWYMIVVILIPLIYLGYVILVAKNKSDYTYLSSITKFIMIAGVLSMLLIFLKF